MQTYTVQLREKREVADQTMAFLFEKPAEFSFRAGQYVAITLPKVEFEDKKGATRCMSISCAPFEDHLMFAMRITDTAFKQTFSHMSLGDEIIIRDAVGHFVLPEDQSRPIIFLAGGIGITPVRSILRQAQKDERKNPFWLFYSNRRPEDAAFIDEMQSFDGLDYHGIDTLTDVIAEACPWQEESGFICADMLRKHLAHVREALYYVVGTPGFSQAMEKMLTEELGVAPADIRKDPFTGM